MVIVKKIMYRILRGTEASSMLEKLSEYLLFILSKHTIMQREKLLAGQFDRNRKMYLFLCIKNAVESPLTFVEKDIKTTRGAVKKLMRVWGVDDNLWEVVLKKFDNVFVLKFSVGDPLEQEV